MNFRSEGIVIGRKSLNDADRLLTLYTKEFGKITCIAKGVKKLKSRKSGHLELGTYCIFYVARGKSLDIITEVETKKAFGMENLPNGKSNDIYHLLELIDHLTVQNQKNHEVYELLVDYLTHIKTTQNSKILLAAFKIKLLSALGFFSSKNLKESKSKELLYKFETENLNHLENRYKEQTNYLKLLTFLDSIIEKITERKLKTSRFINAQI